MTLDWQFINALIQWLIIPMVVMIWRGNERINTFERDLLRVVTIIGEQDKARTLVRQHEADAVMRLEAAIAKQATAIDKLNERLDRILTESGH